MFRNKVGKSKKIFARNLRNNATKSERKLWERIRKEQLGIRFRRQVIIRGWIVDFYSPSKKLIIELDGSKYHNKEKDNLRDNVMESLGLKVIRFPSSMIFNDLEAVIQEVKNNI